jgi:protein tyrosine phosphatase (PTP) superfamily phosphohydrolase (DUF442 family)
MRDLQHIRNFLKIDERVSSSGMPEPRDFAVLREGGFETVINLAMPTSDYAMPNEGELVSAQGMTYVHIPVNFEAPQHADFERFVRIMDACADQKVFVHCAANKRVAAFLFLYRIRSGTAGRDLAEADLQRIWEPDPVWRAFLDRELASLGQPMLKR